MWRCEDCAPGGRAVAGSRLSVSLSVMSGPARWNYGSADLC